MAVSDQAKFPHHLARIERLDPDHTLHSGQAFRWKLLDRARSHWAGVLSPTGSLVEIKRADGCIRASVSPDSSLEDVLSFFRVHDDMTDAFALWSEGHGPEIADAIRRFPGLRVLRQDPVECLFSFMMSSAAPIYRIRRCMDGLCRQYGKMSGLVDGNPMFAFPTVESLSNASREDLDKLGFGFRGGNILLAVHQVLENGGEPWLRGLRQQEYAGAKEALMTLRGVGEKIADCVCLFSLDKDDAVPIDVHMARIADRLFGCQLGSPATRSGYARVSDAFRDRFGARAGWAQQYLYYAEIHANGLWDEDMGRHRPRGE